MDKLKHDLAKVFFVVLRGPSWTKKIFSPALRGQTKLCPYKGFLRGPSWPFVDKKGFLPRPSWTDQIMTWKISVQKNVNEP